MFSRRFERPESQPLEHRPAELLAISPTFELALSLDPHVRTDVHAWAGTLARTVPVSAGTPRALDPDVSFADWSPDGREMVVVRQGDTQNQIEFPRGTVRYSSRGLILCPRVSPSGDRVAFIEGRAGDIGGAAVVVIDKAGGKRTLVSGFKRGLPSGLAWSPTGDEVWYGAIRSGLAQEIRAVTVDGRQKERLLYRETGSIRLLDVARDGRILVSRDRPGEEASSAAMGTADRELSWLDDSYVDGLTSDGRHVLISEEGDGAGPEGADLYIRETSGRPPEKLGPGLTFGFSANDTVVATVSLSSDSPGILLYPVASGTPERIAVKGVEVDMVAGLLPPDHRKIVFNGRAPSRGIRILAGGLRRDQPTPNLTGGRRRDSDIFHFARWPLRPGALRRWVRCHASRLPDHGRRTPSVEGPA